MYATNGVVEDMQGRALDLLSERGTYSLIAGQPCGTGEGAQPGEAW